MEGMEKYHYEDHNKPTWLPPGFRFHPTDEELITYYLARKMADGKFRDEAITEVDLNRHEPWDLPGKAQMLGEKEWYFYALKDRKYPCSSRTNRATKFGYWKATGKDKEVFMKSTATSGPCKQRQLVGMKKTLVFYLGRAPKGSKSNWVMHEYRMFENANIASMLGSIDFIKLKGTKDPWVLCRLFHKKLSHGQVKKDMYPQEGDTENMVATATHIVLAGDEWVRGGAATTYTNKLAKLPLDVVKSLLDLEGADKRAPSTTASTACNTSQPEYSINDSYIAASKSLMETMCEPVLPSLLQEQYSSEHLKDYSKIYSADCTAYSNGQYRNGVSSGDNLGSHATFSNNMNGVASSDPWLPANSTAYTSTPLPSFPSELESLWLHTPSFCV